MGFFFFSLFWSFIAIVTKLHTRLLSCEVNADVECWHVSAVLNAKAYVHLILLFHSSPFSCPLFPIKGEKSRHQTFK